MMDNYKLLLIVCVHFFLNVTDGSGLKLLTSNDTSFSDKTQEMIFNDTIISSTSDNVSELTTEKREDIPINNGSMSQNFQHITNVSMEGRQDVPTNTPATNDAGQTDIPAGSVTNSVSGLSTSNVVGNLSDVESCRHKCGQKQTAPCSCDLQCLVYKNCCEDMLTECPEVVEEIRIKYGHLLNVKVECTPNIFFLITECGTRQPLEDIRTHLSGSLTNSINLTQSTSSSGGEPLSLTTTSSIGESLSTNVTRSMGGTLRFSDPHIQAFINKVYDAYVTDTATGFTYKNMDIFACNARENYVPMIWNTIYDDPHKNINYTTLGSIAQAFTLSSYVPPNLEIVNSLPEECEPGVITSCKNPINTDRNLERKCKEFLSYVYVSCFSSFVKYGNKYCALCELGLESQYARCITASTKLGNTRKSKSEGFTVTLSEQSVSIDTFGEALYPWKTVTCRLPDTNLREPVSGDIPCVIGKCNDYGVLRHEDVCKYSYFTTMAVADDTFPLTSNEYEMFPKFARCFLELHNNVDFDGDFTPTVALFESRRNIVIYATDLFYYDTEYHMYLPQPGIIHHVMLLAKVFKLYRGTTPRTPHTFNIKSTIFSLAAFDEVDGYFLKPPYAATNSNNVTICFCTQFNPFTPRLMRLPCVMSCVQDNVDVQSVSAYLQSPCFSVFNVSTGRARLVEFNLASIFVLLLFSTVLQLNMNLFVMT